MSKRDLAALRNQTLAAAWRATLLQAQWMVRELRKSRAGERRKNGRHRLAKEFRALKALLRAEERRLR